MVPTAGRLSTLLHGRGTYHVLGTSLNSLRQFSCSCSGRPLLARATALSQVSPVYSSVSTTSGLTSAPTRVATSHSLITLYKAVSDDATTLDASFRGRLSTSKCITALANNNLFVGFYVIMPNKRVRPIFQPQRCTLTDPNTGTEHEYLIGHGSNDPRFLRAEFAPVEVAGTLFCLVNVSSTEVPTCYHSGPAFTAAEVTGTNTLDLKDGVPPACPSYPLRRQ